MKKNFLVWCGGVLWGSGVVSGVVSGVGLQDALSNGTLFGHLHSLPYKHIATCALGKKCEKIFSKCVFFSKIRNN